MTEDAPSLHVLMLLDAAYPPALGGGTEMQVRTLAVALRNRGHRVTVLAPLIDPKSQSRIGRVDGTPVCRLPYPRLQIVGGLWLMLRLAALLWSRRGRYDAWHVHSPRRLGAVAAALGYFVDPEVVIKIASATEFERGTLALHPTPFKRLLFHSLRHADAWQAISQRIATTLAARGIPRERIAAIPNAVDTDRFRPRAHVEAGHRRFLFVGRLVPAKDLFTLLEAFAELLQHHPQANLRLVGGGPLETELKRAARMLGIDARIEFAGYRSDVESLLAEADVGVLPSVVEGLSNTLLECMASGLPMIASRVSGSEDLVRPGANGWLFEPGDRTGLADCLAAAVVLPPSQLRAYGAHARATIERYASVNSVVDRMIHLYRGNSPPAVTSGSAASEGA